MHVTICIATYRRPRLLELLLVGLSELTFEQIPAPTVAIVIADNDPKGSAEGVCRKLRGRWPITYCVEPLRGIAAARNRSLHEAGQSDFIAFIDDDEVPDPSWLEKLILAHQRFDADVVSGPVLPMFRPDVPAWIKDGGFFNSPTHRTGDLLPWCATNNTLVAREVFNYVQEFDARFQLSGGEDVHFFSRVVQAGLTIVWCAEAVVHETTGRDRANMRWLLQRAYRGGNCFSMVEQALDSRASTRARRFVKAWLRIAQGTLEATGTLIHGRVQLTKALRRMCLGAGMLAGLVDWRYEPYRTVTGE